MPHCARHGDKCRKLIITKLNISYPSLATKSSQYVIAVDKQDSYACSLEGH